MTVAAKRLSPQCERVLHEMRYCDITSLHAWRYLGVSRLGARIWDLRHKYGYEIESEIVPVVDRFGKTRHVTRYWLADN